MSTPQPTFGDPQLYSESSRQAVIRPETSRSNIDVTNRSNLNNQPLLQATVLLRYVSAADLSANGGSSDGLSYRYAVGVMFATYQDWQASTDHTKPLPQRIWRPAILTSSRVDVSSDASSPHFSVFAKDPQQYTKQVPRAEVNKHRKPLKLPLLPDEPVQYRVSGMFQSCIPERKVGPGDCLQILRCCMWNQSDNEQPQDVKENTMPYVTLPSQVLNQPLEYSFLGFNGVLAPDGGLYHHKVDVPTFGQMAINTIGPADDLPEAFVGAPLMTMGSNVWGIVLGKSASTQPPGAWGTLIPGSRLDICAFTPQILAELKAIEVDKDVLPTKRV